MAGHREREREGERVSSRGWLSEVTPRRRKTSISFDAEKLLAIRKCFMVNEIYKRFIAHCIAFEPDAQCGRSWDTEHGTRDPIFDSAYSQLKQVLGGGIRRRELYGKTAWEFAFVLGKILWHIFFCALYRPFYCFAWGQFVKWFQK